jgi:U3 small nucleolar RNA-associated protein MPP10
VKTESSSALHINELLGSLAPTQAPQTRSKAKAQVQISIDNDTVKALFEPTPITSLFVDGMDDEQVWAQLDLRTKTICRMLDFVLEGAAEGGEEREISEESDNEPLIDEETELKLRAALQAYQNGEHDGDINDVLAKFGLREDGDIDMEGDWEDEEEEDGFGLSGDDDEDTDEDEDDEDGDEEEGEEGLSPLRDHELEPRNRKRPLLPPSRKQKGKSPASELDDGFFNLAEFNADTERAEAKSSSRGRLSGDDSDEEDMDVDLFANIDLNDGDEDGEDGDGEGTFIPFIQYLRSAETFPLQHCTTVTFSNHLQGRRPWHFHRRS